MQGKVYRALLLATSLWVGGPAWADAAVALPTPDAGVEQVIAGKREAYQNVLHQFDAAMAAAPDDPAIAVARCEYIGRFTDEESGEWIEGAPDAFDACGEALAEKWPAASVVQLFQLERIWGDDAIAFGKQHAKAIETWPAPLRRRAYAQLAWSHRHESLLRNEFAWRAVQLGDTELLPNAVDHLAAKRRYAEAARLLAQTPPSVEDWEARKRLEAAMALPDKQVAVRELKRHAAIESDAFSLVAARVLLRAGDLKGARASLQEDATDTEDGRQLAFDIALATRNLPMAIGSVDLADSDHFLENLTRSLTLAMRAPSTLTSPTMLGGVFLFLLMLVAFALVPGLLLVPAHYRGLVRRVRNNPATPLFERVNLLHAWFAGAVALVVPVIAQVVVAPESFLQLMNGDADIARSPALFELLWWSGLAGLVCLLPGVRWIGASRFLGNGAAWRGGWWKVLVAIAALWCVGFLLALYHGATGGGEDTLHTRIVQSATEAGRASFGALATLLLIAVITPIVEELTFRGLILGGLTRHIGFWWANVAQALVFAVVHDDPPRLVFYFALGILAGWLVKATRSLGPAIALHVINNAMVTLLRS